jgi:hypothetical protein
MIGVIVINSPGAAPGDSAHRVKNRLPPTTPPIKLCFYTNKVGKFPLAGMCWA